MINKFDDGDDDESLKIKTALGFSNVPELPHDIMRGAYLYLNNFYLFI